MIHLHQFMYKNIPTPKTLIPKIYRRIPSMVTTFIGVVITGSMCQNTLSPFHLCVILYRCVYKKNNVRLPGA
jgi:hypothetical protein